MGRSFTPYEIHLVNKEFPGLYLSNITWTFPDGTEKKMFTEEEQLIKHEYPTFATLFADRFMDLYYRIPEDTREKVLSDMESMMCAFTNDVDNGNELSKYPDELKQWYFGKLDKGFYYHETNDQLFFDWCMDNLDSFGN